MSEDAFDAMLADLKGAGFSNAPAEDRKPKLVHIEVIHPSPYNARRYFADAELRSLAKSLETGQVAPVLLRPHPSVRDEFELVAGERRYRAAQLAGMSHLHAVVQELDDRQARMLSLSENLFRKDLSAYEQTRGILDLLLLGAQRDPTVRKELQLDGGEEDRQRLRDALEESERAIKRTHDQLPFPKLVALAESTTARFDLAWTSFVKHRLPILDLPEDLAVEIDRGAVSYSHARSLAKIGDARRRRELLAHVKSERLSSRATSSLVQRELFPTDAFDKQTFQRVASVRRNLKPERLDKLTGTARERALALLDELHDLLQRGD